MVEDRAVATWLAREDIRPALPRIRCCTGAAHITTHLLDFLSRKNNKIKVEKDYAMKGGINHPPKHCYCPCIPGKKGLRKGFYLLA